MTTTCALPRKRVRRLGWPGTLVVATWLGAAATLLVLGCWLFGLRFELDLAPTHSLEISERVMRVFLWPTPRTSGDPDCWTLPLWLPLVALALPTVLAWALQHFLSTRKASSPGARRG